MSTFSVNKLSHSFYNFRSFAEGSKVSIELEGIMLDGMRLSSDARFGGRLVDSRNAFVEITDASHNNELINRTIGLAAAMMLQPHHTKPNRYPIITQKVVVPGCIAAYYNPEDIDSNYQGCAPTDKIHHLMGYYAHVAVDGCSLF